MTLSRAIQTLSAWSRAALEAFALDLRLNPHAKPSKPTVDTRAAHLALKNQRARINRDLAASVGRVWP